MNVYDEAIEELTKNHNELQSQVRFNDKKLDDALCAIEELQRDSVKDHKAIRGLHEKIIELGDTVEKQKVQIAALEK